MIRFRSFARHLGVTALTLAALRAQAQQTPTPPVEALQEVIVTGSRIAAPNEQSTSPIQVLSSKYIESSGKTDISDLLTQLPQNFNNALGQDLGNGSSGLLSPGGVATADLRGLGPNRTLVLVDGRRLGQGSPNTLIQSPAPDIDQIPAGLVERVEVVTGGASAAYGSDAIAGVINFIMKNNFEGFLALTAIDGSLLGVSAEPTDGLAATLSYDQVSRVHIKPPAPAPDNFPADTARIASLPSLPSSKPIYEAMELVHVLGMNPLTAAAAAPAAVAANAALKGKQAQLTEASQAYLNAGVLMHVWLFRDWMRTEVPALHSAFIARPDLGVEYSLDIVNSTYHEQRSALPSSQSEETYVVSAADDVMVTFEKAPIPTPLGVMTIGGLTARGYRTEAAFSLSGILGWCSRGRHSLIEVEYVADVADPQPSSALAPDGSKWARENCMSRSAGSHREPGHLTLFRSISYTGAASADFVNVLERGNVSTARQNTESLFSVPANFTKVK